MIASLMPLGLFQELLEELSPAQRKDMIDAYKALNEKCEATLSKIRERKIRMSNMSKVK
jgi:hypothetical protein